VTSYQALPNRNGSKNPRLTPKQELLLKWLLKDVIPKEIAGELGLTCSGVCNSSRAIYRKFGVRTRIGLIVKVLGGAPK